MLTINMAKLSREGAFEKNKKEDSYYHERNFKEKTIQQEDVASSGNVPI